jgi:hypothetical protein
MSIGGVSSEPLEGVPVMNNNLLNDHQIITELIGNAAQLPAQDPRAARWVTEALALASAAELPILIEEAEGVLGRIEHDTTCRWCDGQPGAAIPVGSFWCTH